MFANRVSILQPAEATHEALAQTFGSNCAFPFGGDFVGDGARSDRFGETGSRTDEVKSHSFSGVNTDMNTNSMFAKGNVEGANVFGQKSSVFAGAPPLNSDTNGLPEEFGRSSLSDNRSSPFGSSERISTSVSPFSNQRSARTVFSSVSPTKQFLLEKPLEQPKKFSSSHKQIIAIGILICVFFLVVPLGTVITVPSCQSSSSYCIPQLSMRWMDSDSNTHAAFSSARDAASLLGYLAEDLSSDNDDDTSTLQELINANKDGDPEGPPSYLGTIDTFSLDNVFEIGYWGYCRKNLKTGKSFCNKCMGLDIPSVLVRDAGIQLGDVSNHFNPSVLGKSFVTAYYATLRSLKELPGVAGEVIRNALLIRNTAIAIAILISAEFVLSSLNMLIFLFLVAMVSFDRSFYFIKARLFATLSVTAGIQFVVMLLGFSIAAGQTEYTYTLSQAVDTSGFASVSYGYGNYIAWAKFFSSCVVFVSMLAILVKKPWNPKYRDIAYKN
ncbi:unnamed protein product [Kuraishia capsulata CBS 1993]|uniref:Uncharacterized protein n=1 Tax=Kuraishia capsulata CBS 1993 TaxID=1382522 RepID=W6MIG7_9ASCO|nr:uncharacterized protein KUCA_T00000107001 [Kuraishia capsulata CBS 1993]CDK24147.1 unnamed protein product [Kuraishia capsulata CBS 1993]